MEYSYDFLHRFYTTGRATLSIAGRLLFVFFCVVSLIRFHRHNNVSLVRQAEGVPGEISRAEAAYVLEYAGVPQVIGRCRHVNSYVVSKGGEEVNQLVVAKSIFANSNYAPRRICIE